MAEKPPMPPAEMPPSDMPPAAQGAPAEQAGGGSVMISMPLDAFNAMRQIVTQLSAGLDQLAQSVDQQAGAPQEPTAPTAGAEAPQQAGAGTDEEFLNSMAEEASAGR